MKTSETTSRKASGLAEIVILYLDISQKACIIWRVFIQENNWILERTGNFWVSSGLYVNIRQGPSWIWEWGQQDGVKTAALELPPNKHTNSSAVHRQSCYENSETNWKAPAPGRTQKLDATEVSRRFRAPLAGVPAPAQHQRSGRDSSHPAYCREGRGWLTHSTLQFCYNPSED